MRHARLMPSYCFAPNASFTCKLLNRSHHNPETCVRQWFWPQPLVTHLAGRGSREDNNQLSKHLAQQSLNSTHTRAHYCLVCQISTNTKAFMNKVRVSTLRDQGPEGIALSTTVYEMRKHSWGGETHMRTKENKSNKMSHDMCKVQWEER